MKNDPKVVSFECTSAYMHHRAMLNRRENNNIDALELMRHAVEKSPENIEYKLDLAEMYCEMGCHEQSSRLLLDMLAERGGPSECYYGLALNQLGMNDISGAMRSLNLYRRQDPNGAHSEEVMQLSAELDLFNVMNRPISRRLYRAMRVADRACDAMRENQLDKACRLFEHTLSLASEQYEMRALYAMALVLKGEKALAGKQAAQAAAGFPPSVRALCVCAQVYQLLGDTKVARALLQRAQDEHPDGTELRLLIYTLGEMHLHDQVAEYARLALRETPYDRNLLHVCAVALKESGETDPQLGRFWTRILRIDPEDSIAQFYQNAAIQGTLDQMELDYTYQVPADEYERRLRELVDHINRGFEHVCKIWEESSAFRQLVRWAVESEDTQLGRASMTVLTMMECPEAQSILRELMFSAEVSTELKFYAAALLKFRGKDMKKILPPDIDPTDGILPDAEGLLACIPVGERQLVRLADEVLMQEYHISALSALTLMWAAYRKLRGTRTDPLICIEGAAAALSYCYLLGHDQRPNIGVLARDFGCSPRQLTFYARRIAACLKDTGRNTTDEDLRF